MIARRRTGQTEVGGVGAPQIRSRCARMQLLEEKCVSYTIVAERRRNAKHVTRSWLPTAGG